jgi:hypothetical protein
MGDDTCGVVIFKNTIQTLIDIYCGEKHLNYVLYVDPDVVVSGSNGLKSEIYFTIDRGSKLVVEMVFKESHLIQINFIRQIIITTYIIDPFESWL